MPIDDCVRVVDQLTPKFSPKDPLTTEYFFFDFSVEAIGEVIQSANVALAVVLGTDAGVLSELVGSPVIDGLKVKQLVTGGVLDVVYQLVCTITTLQGHKFTKSGNYQVLET